MLFDKLFDFLALYLALVLFIALMGMKFAKKHKELNAEFGANSKLNAGGEFGENVKFDRNSQFDTHAEFDESVTLKAKKTRKKSVFSGLYKHCPCRKAVENGTMSSICVYSGVAGFMLSVTNVALMSNYSTTNFIVFALSLICLWFGWVLKK